MILENNYAEAYTSSSDSMAMSIAVNPIVYDILSSRIYSNRILACIREVSTNGLDACTTIGNTQPLEVHLPTRIEPFFSVQDFGIGMPKEVITSVYSILGASTKRDSNAYNGALGIGKLAPLQLSGNFTVDSTYEGKRTIISVYLNEGIPTISILGEYENAGESGTTVSVPVRNEDINRFTSEAESLYRWFKVKPIVNTELNMEVPEIAFEGTGWKIYKGLINGGILMANVLYPIASKENFRILDHHGLVIEANTGDVQFAASREALSYTDITNAKLKEYDELIFAELTEKVKVLKDTYKHSLVEFCEVLTALPYIIRRSIKGSELHPNMSTLGVITNAALKFSVARYNSRIESTTDVRSDLLQGRTIIIGDVVTKVKACILTAQASFVGLSIRGAVADVGGKEAAIKLMQDFCVVLGLPWVLASEMHAEHFAVVKVAGKKVVAKSDYQASGLEYTPGRSDYHERTLSIRLGMATKDVTIGVPVRNNKIVSGDYTTELDVYVKSIHKLLVHLKYPTGVNIAVIPYSHKKQMAFTTDIFTFIRGLDLSGITYRPEGIPKVSRILSGFSMPNLKRTPSLPQDFLDMYETALLLDKLISKEDADYVHRILEAFGNTNKLKAYDVPKSYHTSYTRYEPLTLCTFRSYTSDMKVPELFSTMVNALSTTSRTRSKVPLSKPVI